jgi:hypothetical protein
MVVRIMVVVVMMMKHILKIYKWGGGGGGTQLGKRPIERAPKAGILCRGSGASIPENFENMETPELLFGAFCGSV